MDESCASGVYVCIYVQVCVCLQIESLDEVAREVFVHVCNVPEGVSVWFRECLNAYTTYNEF